MANIYKNKQKISYYEMTIQTKKSLKKLAYDIEMLKTIEASN